MSAKTALNSMNMQIGPKYLNALERVNSISNLKSIEVQLPIIGGTAFVSPMTSKEEQELRTARVSTNGFLDKITELLYKHTKFKDKEYDSLGSFSRDLYTSDKSMLVWAIMAASYSKLPTIARACENCGSTIEAKLDPGDVLKEDGLPKLWDKDVPPSEYTITKSIMDGAITFELSMPNDAERSELSTLFAPSTTKKNIAETGDIFSYYVNLIFFIKKVQIKGEDEDIILTNRIQDIYPFMQELNPKVKDIIMGEINIDEFEEYIPKFYEDVPCPSCNNLERFYVYPEIEFFRKALSIY